MFACCAAAFLLYRFPPETYTFYPRCPIYAVFGIHCPGCGMTRAAARLLHGDLAGAFHRNIFSIPLAFTALAVFIRKLY